MNSKVVIVAGSPGAGKTTLLKGLGGHRSLKIVNMGTLMLTVATRNGLADDRDKMRLLSNEQVSVIRDKAFAEIAAMDGDIIVDTHATVEAGGRYLPGLPIEAIKRIRGLAGLIYIDALTEDVIERRKMDKSRKREAEDKIRIDDQRQINMSMLSICSSHLNIPLYIIFNRQGRLDESVKSLKEEVKAIFGES